MVKLFKRQPSSQSLLGEPQVFKKIISSELTVNPGVLCLDYEPYSCDREVAAMTRRTNNQEINLAEHFRKQSTTFCLICGIRIK